MISTKKYMLLHQSRIKEVNLKKQRIEVCLSNLAKKKTEIRNYLNSALELQM
jgi:hypothetical protein